MQLYNVKQQNAHLSNWCFNSILCFVCMCRTSCVYHQEDHVYMQILW